MFKFSKRGIKTLLILSCSSVLASALEAPIIYAAESIVTSTNQTDVEEEKANDIVTTEEKVFSVLPVDKQEDSQIESLTLNIEEMLLEGITSPASTVRIIFADQVELVSLSDEEGTFIVKDFSVLEGEEFQIVVEDEAGEILETGVYTMEEAAAPEEETDAPETQPVEETSDEVVGEEVIEEVTEPVEENKAPEEQTEEVQEEVQEEPEEQEEQAAETAPVQEAQMQTFQTFSMRTAPVEKKGTTYYYIKSGDNLKQIAESFNVKVEDLLRWNNIDNANKIYVEQIISVNGTNDYHNYNTESTTFANSREFLQYVSKYAKDIAANYDLYASIMIAQAALETGYGTSALGAKANNLFGIKTGDGYDGYSIVMRTWEVINGKKIYEDAYFRLYPSFYDSFIDYAEKLRNGKFMWDKNFYNGTWVENTNTFKDTTLFLTGRYATDPRYYFKLNSIILSNNLHQYDERPYTDLSYEALITRNNFPVGNVPFDQVLSNNYWYPNIKEVAHTKDLLGTFVQVTQVTRNGQYANIYLDGTEIGWLHTDALTTINLDIKNVSFDAYFASQNGNINAYPLGQAGTTVIGKTGDYLNQKVQITSQTADGLQSYVTLNGQGLGWVLTSDLGTAVTPYTVTMTNGTFNVDSLPWGTPGYKTLAKTSKYMGEELQVIGKSQNGYLLVSLKGKPLGWVDSRAINAFQYTAKNYQTYISGGQYEINSLPWGDKGFKKLGMTSTHLGKYVTITKESANKAYVFAVADGKDIGWIDKRAFGFSNGTYDALVTHGNYNVDTLPWGTPGFKKLGYTSSYQGEMVHVVGATQNGAYLLVSQNGKNIGWIDSRAVRRYDSVPVNYTSVVTSGSYEIDTLPWGEAGFKKVGTTASLVGRSATILRESKNRAYAYTLVDGSPVGWIDKKAFGFKEKPYKAVISEGKYEINTLPWGTPGFKRTGYTKELLGKQIDVVGQTQNGAYLLIQVAGKEIGWIDHRSISREIVTPVNYSQTVKNGKYEINSLPWGVPGFKRLGMTASLQGKTVQVTLESSNKAYVFVFENGNPVGWIDKRAFQ